MADDSINCDFGTLKDGEIGVGAVYAGPVYDMDRHGFATFKIDFAETGSYDIYLTCRTQHAVLDITQDYRVVSTKEITRDHATHEIAWANPTEEKIGTVNVYKTGESLIGFDVVSVDVTIGVDSMRLVRTGDAPAKLEWYATDTNDVSEEAGYNRWVGGYGMYSPLYISFDVDFEESGNYDLYASLGARNASLEVCVDGTALFTAPVTSDHDTDENSWLNPQEYLLGNLNIEEEGIHTIRFNVKEAHNSILFRQMRLVRKGDPLPPQILPIKVEFEDYNPGGQNVGYFDSTPGVVPAWCIDRGDDVEYGKGASGYLVSFGVGEWMKYDVNAKKAGRYEVIVSYAMTDMKDVTVALDNGETEVCSKVLYPTGAWETYKEESIGVVNLSEGINTLKFSMVSREMNVDYFILNPLEDTPLLKEMTMNETNVTESGIAPYGADAIVLTFTEAVEVSDDSITLYQGSDLIPISFEADGNVVTVALKQCLEPSESYELNLSNIKSSSDGTFMEDVAVEFETNTDGTHDGSIEDASAEVIEGRKIKITGIAKSSQGVGIKGRELSLYLDSQKVAEITSGEDGVFTFIYEIPSDVLAKLHNFKISSGNTETNVSALYVSDARKQEITEIFSEADDKEDIKKACEEYCAELSLNYENEIGKVKNPDEFHSFFVGKVYEKPEDVINIYNVALALGMIQAADETDDINAILSQDRFVLPLDVEESYYLEERGGMLTEIFEAKNSKYDELYNIVKDAVRKSFLSQCGLSDAETVSKDGTFDDDEMVLIDLGFMETIKNATKVTFIYECDDLADFEDLSVEAKGKMSADIKQNGNQLIIEFSNLAASKDFGTMKFSASAGDYSIEEQCEIVYDVSGYPMDAVAKSENKTIEIEIKEPKKQSGGSGGGGGAISSSGEGFMSNQGNHITNKDEEEKPQDTKPEFKDLNEASWAESYVISLYENGIVSMPADGKFRPNDNVTREEFLKMLVMAFELYDETATSTFSDVEKGSWYYPYVASGQKYGIILGNEQNRFDVGRQITREDMSVMIARILVEFGYQAESAEEFADNDEIASYAKEAVALMKYLEIVNGMGDGTFAPKAQTTRAQAAKVICKAMEVIGR